MTKRNWDKADRYDLDPGRIVEVPEPTRPERWVPPAEREQRAAQRAKRNRELRERSEQHDLDLFARGLLAGIREKEQRGEPLDNWDKILLHRYEDKNL